MLPIDTQFDTNFADTLAKMESYNKHLYRPNSYLHKWWARRCGSTFRTILKSLVTDKAAEGYYTAGGLQGKIVLDPMMGGGTTLHEAIRMGANVIGADIDPIPILQARATLSEAELPLLEAAFAKFHATLRQELSPLYQTSCLTCDRSAEMKFMLYGTRRRCNCREAIFVNSRILRFNKDGTMITVDAETHDIFYGDQKAGTANPPAPLKLMILEKSVKRCERCGGEFTETASTAFGESIPYYKRYTPIAIVGKCAQHKLFFAPLRDDDWNIIAQADRMRANLPFNPADFQIMAGPKSKSLLDRGIQCYLDLFSSRQLLYLHAAMGLLGDLPPVEQLNLALLTSTSLEFNSMLCGYKGAKRYKNDRSGAIRHTFAYHAYSFPYTALENNPVHPVRASGNLRNLFLSRIVRGRKWAAAPIEREVKGGKAHKVTIMGEQDGGREVFSVDELATGSQRFLLRQGSSVALDLPDGCVDYVVTDPPYFDSVQYSDLVTFFRVWLRQMLPNDAEWEVALAETAVDQQSYGAIDPNDQYASVLTGIFKECRRVMKKNGRLIFTFHHRNPKGWAALTLALRRAGFRLINRYVVHAENPVSVHIANQNALLHDVILLFAPVSAAVEPVEVWKRPLSIPLNDSAEFCYDCGTAVGWTLNSKKNDAEIQSAWKMMLG